MQLVQDQYQVVGNPIKHSQSPWIHSQFAQQTQQNLGYIACQLSLDNFEAEIRTFFSQPQNKGCNVTVPFKERAFHLVDELTERAQQAGAVNTIKKQTNGQLLGDNTDGVGLVRDLLAKGVNIAGSKLLIVGAGGAARGVLQPLLAQQPQQLVITNRTLGKAQELVQRFSHNTSISAQPMSQLDQAFDLIINATSASLSGDIPALLTAVINAKTVCYDMMYGAQPTPFNQWAKAQGCPYYYDGLGMLVEQAAESFWLWRAVKPETTSVISQLRARLKG